jgi:hypothetical protein
MVNLKALRQFLIDSNKAGYAGGEEKKWIKESDQSTSIPFKKYPWRSHDNFFGGEPYGGRTVVSYKEKPVWMIVYYGWVEEGIENNLVYGILKSALMHMPSEYPFRGPKEFTEGEFVYTNVWQGELKRFFGEENITRKGKPLYKANYIGGLVDQKVGV